MSPALSDCSLRHRGQPNVDLELHILTNNRGPRLESFLRLSEKGQNRASIIVTQRLIRVGIPGRTRIVALCALYSRLSKDLSKVGFQRSGTALLRSAEYLFPVAAGPPKRRFQSLPKGFRGAKLFWPPEQEVSASRTSTATIQSRCAPELLIRQLSALGIDFLSHRRSQGAHAKRRGLLFVLRFQVPSLGQT